MKNFGIYIHIPFCKSRCKYCDFSSCTDFSLVEKYFERLICEIENCQFSGVVDSIFFGGGTPTAVSPKYVESVLNALAGKFNITADCEISIECNPDSIDYSAAKAYLAQNINRFSVGVQSFDDKLLKLLGRAHDSKKAQDALALLKDCENVSIDLMLGLPTQTVSDIELSLAMIEKFQIFHVSAYALKVEDGTKFSFDGVQENDDLAAELLEKLQKELKTKKITRYEVSNFAKDGFECRHNLKYWQRNNYLGFGAAAHSLVDNLRFSNSESINDYIRQNKVEKISLTNADAEYEYIILNLRTKFGIDLLNFEKNFGCAFLEKYAKSINKNDYSVQNDHLIVREEKLNLLNQILIKF